MKNLQIKVSIEVIQSDGWGSNSDTLAAATITTKADEDIDDVSSILDDHAQEAVLLTQRRLKVRTAAIRTAELAQDERNRTMA